MFNKSDISRDELQLVRGQAKKGYDWWWHSFTAHNKKTNEERPFFIEFFLVNPALAEDKPVLGQLKENQEAGKHPSYLMVKFGTWGKGKLQLHNFYSWKEIEVQGKKPFHIKANENYCDETTLKGHVVVTKEDVKNHPEWMCDAGEATWDLKIKKDIAYNVGYGAGKLFRGLQLFEMFWHAEGMKSYFSGTITLNGEEYVVREEDCYGYSDKNWGKDFTSPWVWLSSNNLYSVTQKKQLNNSVFDIGGGRPKVGFIALNRKLLSAFYLEGREFEFNFSKFWTFCRTKFDCKEEDGLIKWHIEQKTVRNKMVVDITCRQEDMLFVNYEAPNGKKLHNRLWNGGNGEGVIKLYHKGELVDEIIAKNIGCEYGVYDEEQPTK